MTRSLTRNIIRAARRTPDSSQKFTHLVEVQIIFPLATFADAPTPWSPGPDFTELAGGSWLRDNRDGTQTAVVTGVGPKQLPAADGGVWTDTEVWTVTASDPNIFAHLHDKPHRITRALGRPGAQITREPQTGHPADAAEDYWLDVYMTHNFLPSKRPDGRYALTLACAPNASWEYGPWPLADACKRFMSWPGVRAVVRNVTDTNPGTNTHPQSSVLRMHRFSRI
ncbi:hypothetical protein [Streptomyces sp. NPDC001889]